MLHTEIQLYVYDLYLGWIKCSQIVKLIDGFK